MMMAHGQCTFYNKSRYEMRVTNLGVCSNGLWQLRVTSSQRGYAGKVVLQAGLLLVFHKYDIVNLTSSNSRVGEPFCHCQVFLQNQIIKNGSRMRTQASK